MSIWNKDKANYIPSRFVLGLKETSNQTYAMRKKRPNDGSMFTTSFKLSGVYINKIKEEVETGRFVSRSDFLRHIIRRYFEESSNGD